MNTQTELLNTDRTLVVFKRLININRFVVPNEEENARYGAWYLGSV